MYVTNYTITHIQYLQCLLPRIEIRLHRTIWFWIWNHKNTLVLGAYIQFNRLKNNHILHIQICQSIRQTDRYESTLLFFPIFCSYICTFIPGSTPLPSSLEPSSDPTRIQRKTKLIQLNHISHILVTIKNCSIKFLCDFYNILLHAVAWWWSHYMISTKCTFHIIPCGLVSSFIIYLLSLLL